MVRTSLIVILYILVVTGCRTSSPLVHDETVRDQQIQGRQQEVAVNYADQVTWVLGYFQITRLKQEPHGTWFYKGYDSYQPDGNAMASLRKTGTDGITISVVMGTWCPDSRREVPRFMKVIDGWEFPYDKITFIGVDDAKLSPVGGYGNLDIQRVPTFIIYKNNIETGRIIENPVTSLEQDMVKILEGIKNNK